MTANPHCPRCAGTGIFYAYQKETVVTQTLGLNDGSGIIEVSEEYESADLEMVYDFNGNMLKAEKLGVYISIENPPIKGTFLYAVMKAKTARRIAEAGCEDAGGGYFRVKGLQSRRAGIDGLYHTAPADIIGIGKIIDAAGNEWQAEEFRADMFRVKPPNANEEPSEIAEPLSVQGVEYVPPFIFAMLSQNLTEADSKEVVDAKGDAICSFPYNCDVGDDDVLTVLSGTYTQKEAVNRVAAEYDVIGAFFVMDVSSCFGVGREYQKGIDFILAGTNRIKWLCADAPAPGETYSVTFQVCPTYKVIKTIPQVRVAENQRLPKKAVVKFYSAYGEKKGVNRQ